MFVNVVFFEQFWRCGVQNIYRSFLSRTGIELSIPTTSVVSTVHRPLRRRTAGSPQRLDGFPGKSRLRPYAAARGGGQRPHRGCRASALKRRRGGRQERLWPGVSIRQAGPEILSPTSECLACLAKLWLFTPKHATNAGINVAVLINCI